MKDGIPFVTFVWSVTVHEFYRHTTDFKFGDKEDEEDSIDVYEMQAMERHTHLRPLGAKPYRALRPPDTYTWGDNKIYNIAAVVVVDVRTSQYGAIMGWNWDMLH